tara:strand:+ start:712 stop:1068 length:357 start_codon:yes stop_codon:yes gene_type:complete
MRHEEKKKLIKVLGKKQKNEVAKEIYSRDKNRVIEKEEKRGLRNHKPIKIGSKIMGGTVISSDTKETIIRKGGKSLYFHTRKLNAVDKNDFYDIKPFREERQYIDMPTKKRWEIKMKK